MAIRQDLSLSLDRCMSPVLIRNKRSHSLAEPSRRTLSSPMLLAPSMLALLCRVRRLWRPLRYCRALCTALMLGRKRIGDSLHPTLVGGKRARGDLRHSNEQRPVSRTCQLQLELH